MSLENEKERWEQETLKPVTDRFPERKEDFKTSSDIPLPPILTPSDFEGYQDKIGFPGEYPLN